VRCDAPGTRAASDDELNDGTVPAIVSSWPHTLL